MPLKNQPLVLMQDNDSEGFGLHGGPLSTASDGRVVPNHSLAYSCAINGDPWTSLLAMEVALVDHPADGGGFVVVPGTTECSLLLFGSSPRCRQVRTSWPFHRPIDSQMASCQTNGKRLLCSPSSTRATCCSSQKPQCTDRLRGGMSTSDGSPCTDLHQQTWHVRVFDGFTG